MKQMTHVNMMSANVKKSLRTFLVLLSLCAAHVSSFAAASNFHCIDSLSFLAAQRVAAQLNAKRLTTFSVDCTPHSARWLVQQNMTRACAQLGMPIDPKGTVLTVGIADCAVRYALATDRDSLQRISRVELRTTMPGQTFEDVVVQSTDLIARSEIPLAENPKYDFSSSVVPPAPRSTWDDIVEPLVILGVLATTVIVLFTVRSQ